MIAKIFPEAYDTEGRLTFRPDQQRRRRFPSTFPFGRYVSHPLTVSCKSLEELRIFLQKCRYVSDEDQFGSRDYWMPPEEFEKSHKGDCEDFSLYAWRQLINMGYDARFVGGRVGDSPSKHAWVTFVRDGDHFLLEPQARYFGLRFPRLDALRYQPDVSVTWDGDKVHFYFHQPRKFVPPLTQFPLLLCEWVFYHLGSLLYFLYLTPVALAKFVRRKFFKPAKNS
jgi:hypothetical protein